MKAILTISSPHARLLRWIQRCGQYRRKCSRSMEGLITWGSVMCRGGLEGCRQSLPCHSSPGIELGTSGPPDWTMTWGGSSTTRSENTTSASVLKMRAYSASVSSGITSTAPPQCGHVSGRRSITCPMRLTTSSSVSPARSVATDRGRPPPRLPGTPPEYRAPPWGWAIFGGLLSKLLNALLRALPASGSPSLLI